MKLSSIDFETQFFFLKTWQIQTEVRIWYLCVNFIYSNFFPDFRNVGTRLAVHCTLPEVFGVSAILWYSRWDVLIVQSKFTLKHYEKIPLWKNALVRTSHDNMSWNLLTFHDNILIITEFTYGMNMLFHITYIRLGAHFHIQNTVPYLVPTYQLTSNVIFFIL